MNRQQDAPIFYVDRDISPHHWLICKFQLSNTIICYCGKTFNQLANLTFSEVTKKVSIHIKQKGESHHPPLNGRKPGLNKIADFLGSDPCFEICPKNTRCVVTREEIFNMNGLGYLRTIDYIETKAEACLSCLKVKGVDHKGNTPCCSTQDIQQVTYFGRGLNKNNGIIVIDTPVLGSNQVIPVSSLNATTTPLIRCEEDLGNGKVKVRVIQLDQVVEKEGCSESIISSSIEGVEHDPIYLKFSFKSKINLDFMNSIQPISFDRSCSDGSPYTKLAKLLLKNQIDDAGNIPSTIKIKRAELNKPIDKNDRNEFLILKSCEILFGKGEAAVSRLDATERKFIGTLPQLGNMHSPVDEIENLGRLIQVDLLGSQSSSRKRIVLVARLLVAVLRSKKLGHQHLLKRIEQDQQLPENEGLPPQEWTYKHVQTMAADYICSILESPTSCIEMLLSFVMFRKTSNNHNLETTEQEIDEDDELQAFDNVVQSEETDSGVVFNSIAAIRSFGQALLRAMKLTKALELHSRKMEMITRLEYLEQGDEFIFTPNILQQMKAELEGKMAAPNLASILRDLSALNDVGPSKLNAARLVTLDSGDLEIQCNVCGLGLLDFQTGAKILIEKARGIFTEIFGHVQEAHEMFSDVLNADSDRFKIEKAEHHNAATFTEEYVEIYELLVSTRGGRDTDEMIKLFTQFHYCLLSLVYFFSNVVLRARELENLKLFEGNHDPGNLHHIRDLDRVSCLALSTIVTKTSKGASGIIPNFIVKLFLIYRNILRPYIKQILVEHARKKDQNCDVEALEKQVDKDIGKQYRVLPCFLLNALGKAEPLRTLSEGQVGSIIREFVCRGALSLEKVTYEQMRHLILQLKVHYDRFIEQELKKNASSPSAPRLKTILDRRNLNDDLVRGSLDAGTLGHHSGLTQIRSYSGSSTFGSRNMSDPETEVHLNCSAALGELFSLSKPMPQMNNNFLDLPFNRTSIAERLNIPNANMTSRQYLLEELRRINEPKPVLHIQSTKESNNKPRFTSFSDGQEAATEFLFENKIRHCGIYFSCGGGKTLSVLLPLVLSLKEHNSFVLIIVPFVALCMSVKQACKNLDKLRCFEFNYPVVKQMLTSTNRQDYPNVVVGVVDRILQKDSIELLQNCARKNILRSIVVDEAQCYVTDNYRTFAEFDRLRYINSIDTKLIFLSGTMPKPIKSSFYSLLGIQEQNVKEFTSKFEINNKKSIISFAETQVSTEEALHKLGVKILSIRLQVQASKADCRSILVFSMTTEGNAHMFDLAKAAFMDRLNLKFVKLTSKSGLSERVEFVETFEEPSDTNIRIGFCTTAGQSGIDYKSVGFVLCLGGSHGGVMSVVQMAARLSRQKNSTRGEYLMIYSPILLRQSYFRSFAKFQEKENFSITGMNLVERSEGRRFVTYESVDRLFMERKCGSRKIEVVFGTQDGKECGCCNECNINGWTYRKELPLVQRTCYSFEENSWLGQDSTGPPVNEEMEETTKDPSKKTSQDSIDEHCSRLIEEYGSGCPLCKVEEEFRDEHHPGKCTKLKNMLYLQGCNLCLNKARHYKDIKRSYENKEKDEQYELSRDCAIFITGCAQWQFNKLCPNCLLDHKVEAGCTVSKVFVKSILFYVFFSKTKFREVMQECMTAREREKIKGFPSFFRWAVYGQTALIPNVRYVLGYYHSKWIKE